MIQSCFEHSRDIPKIGPALETHSRLVRRVQVGYEELTRFNEISLRSVPFFFFFFLLAYADVTGPARRPCLTRVSACTVGSSNYSPSWIKWPCGHVAYCIDMRNDSGEVRIHRACLVCKAQLSFDSYVPFVWNLVARDLDAS